MEDCAILLVSEATVKIIIEIDTNNQLLVHTIIKHIHLVDSKDERVELGATEAVTDDEVVTAVKGGPIMVCLL